MPINLVFRSHRWKVIFVACVISLVWDLTWSSNDIGERSRREETDSDPSGCQPPPPIKNGFILNVTKPVNGVYPTGAVVLYSCHDGFRLVGEPSNHCTQQKSWSHHSAQFCMKHTFDPPFCPDPPQPDYLEIEGLRAYYPVYSVVVYHCKYVPQLPNPDVLTCVQGGRWDPPVPSDQCALPTSSPPSKKEQLSTLIINIILYLSIILLVLFCIAVAVNVRAKRRRKARGPTRGSFFDLFLNRLSDTDNNNRVVQEDRHSTGNGSPLIPLPPLSQGSNGLPNGIPSAPPYSNDHSSYQLTDSNTTLNGIDEPPPSYDEVTSLRPPSFNSAQQLRSSPPFTSSNSFT